MPAWHGHNFPTSVESGGREERWLSQSSDLERKAHQAFRRLREPIGANVSAAADAAERCLNCKMPEGILAASQACLVEPNLITTNSPVSVHYHAGCRSVALVVCDSSHV